MIASRDLENWALIQPGGDTLKLKIKVEMEEKLYLRQILANSTIVKPVNPTPKQLGNMKAIKLTFSDRYTTQVAFSLQNISPDYHNLFVGAVPCQEKGIQDGWKPPTVSRYQRQRLPSKYWRGD